MDIQKLTKEQAVIITGFTGILCGSFSDFHADVEKRLGRGVWTFEMGMKPFMAEIKKLYEADFIEIATVCVDQAQAVPEGFVLVPESKISHFWQDNDEPENLCIDASGFNSLGDCIDDGEVMIVNKFTQANISKQKMFGVWCTCEPKPFTRFIKEFKLFDTQEEAEQAMIEAQEQSHE